VNPTVVFGAALIGISLGLTGAGGSIITLPVVVYLAGVPEKEAVGLSLFVVGVAAAAGALRRMMAKELHLRVASIFVVSGVIGAFIGAKFTGLLPKGWLMILFAILMVIVALRMFAARNKVDSEAADYHPAKCFGVGLGVGVLTGFIGVGGGFLLVPALARFARLPMRMAMGTSLAIIAFNSFSGYISHYGDAPPRVELMTVFSVIAAAGVLLGAHFSSKLPVPVLRKVFAVAVMLASAAIFWKTAHHG